ncbi:hypothetical protein ACR9VJ_26600 [Streptomyces sp. H49]|uniref:hypothetical protein n=1 Tax=Streptomyces sp. H49 TaxID=3444117 RepID=UPI003F4AB8B0
MATTTTVPPFTPCPGGFITARPLPDGRTLVEGWAINVTPFDGGEPRHDVAYHWITTGEQETAETVAEFARYLAEPIAP